MKHYQDSFDDECEELIILRWFRDNFVSKNDIDYYEKDAMVLLDEDYTWEDVSYCSYGDISFAHELKLYNAYYNFDDEILPRKTVVFIPSLERLEEYIDGKRLIKKL